jgi:phage I-like protein
MPARTTKLSQTAVAALGAYSVDLFEGNEKRVPPKEFRIFPAGLVKTRKGEFMFDEPAAAALMAAYREHDVDLTVDYDHHTLYTDRGVKAVSAGWFHLDLRNGELWATDVNWNPPAIEHFANGEYRYFSPLFDYERASLRITNLINNALTNTPAMDGIEALIAASATTGDGNMLTDEEIKKLQAKVAALETSVSDKDRQITSLQGQTTTAALATTVGLATTAKDGDVQTAVTGLVRFRAQVLEVLEKKDEATAIGALSALKDKASEAAKLGEKIVEIEQAALSAEWKGYLDKLSTQGEGGKFLPPARRQKAEQMAIAIGGGTLTRKGIDGAKEYVVEMLSAGTAVTAGRELPQGLGLDTEALKMLSVQGANVQDFIKFETARIAAGGR